MEYQIDTSGMHVENPLELQMLFSEQIFLDDRDTSDLNPIQTEKAGGHEEKMVAAAAATIGFFIDMEATREAGFTDIENLLGRMLMVTQLDGKIPTMELADVFDIAKFSEEQFSEKVKLCRKTIVFSDHWPFKQNIANKLQIITIENVQLFYAPSVPAIMNNIELKKAFAAGLKNYFCEG